MTLETFIKIKFGTQNKLGEALEVGQNTRTAACKMGRCTC
jgi:hypothetical protein